MDFSHRDLNCNGNCVLSNAQFVGRVAELAGYIVTRARMTLQLPADTCHMVVLPILPEYRPEELVSYIQLYPSDLYSRIHLCIQVNDSEDADLKNRIFHCLQSELERQRQIGPPPVTHDDEVIKIEDVFQAFLAAGQQNADLFRTTIEAIRTLIPPCLWKSLLYHTVINSFDEGVASLLQLGAADYVAQRGGHDIGMLRVCISAYSEPYRIFMEQDNLDAHHRQIVDRVNKIFETLLPYIAASNVRLRKGDFQFICCLATFNPTGCEKILEVTRKPDYDEEGYYNGLLATVVEDLCNQRMHRNNVKIVANIFSFTMLPLVRAGARCDISDFMFSRKFGPILRLIAQHRPSLYPVMLAVIGEVKYGHAKKVCLIRIKAAAGDFTAVTDAFLAQYPRRLQSICRSAVLKQFSLGLVDRCQKIESLHLPQCVADFLNFKDFPLSSELNSV